MSTNITASQYFGIYSEVIDSVASTCETLLQEARDVLYELGKRTEGYELIENNLHEEVGRNLDLVRVFEVTDTIISEYLNVTADLLDESKTLRKLGITFEIEKDGVDSGINILNENDGDSGWIYEKDGDFHEIVKDALTYEVSAIARKADMRLSVNELSKCEFKDLARCYSTGKITDTLKESLGVAPAARNTIERD